MTQTTNVPPQTPADAYPTAFMTVYQAVRGKIDVPKLVRLGDLCFVLATNNVKSLADERDALFTRLFAGRAEATRELGRQYMLAADEAGKWDSERR